MNHDEKFQQIWEFRRRDDDGDSSDDSKSNPIGESADEKPKLDIVLLDNDDISNGVETVEPAKKKRKPNKKKNVVKNKSKSCSVKEEKKGKRSRKLDDTKEAGMFEDLKIFADSLINELKVDRENMFEQMKEETRKFVNSSSKPRKKKVVRSNKKNKTPPLQNGIESNVKSQNCPGGLVEEHMKSNKIYNGNQVLEFPMTNKQPSDCERGKLLVKSRMDIAKDTDHVVSSQYLTLPTVVPKPHSQSHRDPNHLNGCIPVLAPENKSDGPHVKPINPRNYYQGVPVLQSERFQSFSHISSKNFGFLDQNCSEMTSGSVGFRSPNDSSNLSISQNYSDNVFEDNSSRVGGMRMNARRFNNGGIGASSGGNLRNCTTSNDMIQTNGGDSVPFGSQEMKEQFYSNLRNKN